MSRNASLATSGFFLLVALAFLVLWPITFLNPLSVTYPGSSPSVSYEYGIGQGRIWFDEITHTKYRVNSSPTAPWATSKAVKSYRLRLWFCAAVAFTLAAVPWLPHPKYRFSLRNLLIIMTLVALLLGIIIWVTR
jgi:hypothetical protein